MANTVSIEPTVEESIVLALFDLTNLLTRKGEELARQSKLTTQQWMVLLHVVGDPNFTSGAAAGDGRRGVLPSDIARARGVSRANVSVLVAGLLDRGFVRQIKDPTDGRRKRLVATAAGRRAVAAIEPARREANRRLLAGLSERQRATFLSALRGCLEVVRASGDDAGD